MTVTTPLGQVRDADGMRLEFVRTYTDPVDDVWSALTEPDRTARWIGTWTGDPTTGTVPSPDGTWRLSVSLSTQDHVTTLVFVQRLADAYALPS